jgi:hypothetical protein
MACEHCECDSCYAGTEACDGIIRLCTSIINHSQSMSTIATETLAQLTSTHCKSYRVLYSQFHGIANTSNMPHAAYDT